ncbi:MAG TPA: multidrug efflux RND transporter permease subunit [Microvirga sp.]|jgi:HAE1 family hydrophobic/amphiphilic exporter-1|nr:multidrug efflux RND transporter permease subunit [Microvirga sp.]
MKAAHFFIDRPIFASVLSIVILLVGLVAYADLPVAQYPEIAPPTIVVRASYPGANAETVAATVATPLEQEINGVEDMLYMSSYSTSDGAMALTITFKLGTDLDTANVLVQNRVATATPRLPDEVRRLGVTTRKSSPDLMMVVHLLSPDESYNQLYVSNYAAIRVRDQLLRLDGVGDISILGAREYSLRVWLDPNKLSAYQLTAGDIVRALQEQNVQVSGGALGGQPAPADNAFQLTVQTQGRFDEVREFRQVIVKASPDGRLVRLGDVARVELGARDYVTNAYLNGKPAVALLVYQRPGSNALDAAAGIIGKMDELKKDFPSGLDYRIAYNPTEFIADSVREVYKTLFEAVVLVVIVIVVFLQSWRTAIIPIVAIPVSLVGTFAVMAAFGFSLNNLTLFGLVLAIGIVVDDAIVVVENVERNIAQGMSPGDAAHATMDEVGPAVLAIALVLSAVFVPTAFLPGISGEFYRQFALTIAASTVISTVNSLTLSPALCALLLKPHDPHHPPRFVGTRFGLWLGRGFNTGFDKVSHAYAGTVHGLVAHKAVLAGALAVYAGLLYGTSYVAQAVPTGFIPTLDRGYVIVVVQTPEGASLSRTDEVSRRASDILRQTPGVKDASAFAGFSGATFTNAPNAAAVFAVLEPFEQRIRDNLPASAIIADLSQRLQVLQEAFIIVIPPPPVPGIGSAGGFKMQVEDRGGIGLQELLAASRTLIGSANQDPNLARVFTTFGTNTPQIFLDIDRTKARILNVPLANVFETLQIYLGSAYANDFNYLGRVNQVRVQADQKFRLDREDIERLKTRSATGDLVPLGSLVHIRDTAGPELVQRYNMFPSVPVQGDAAGGVSTGQALAAMERLADALPQGAGFEWTELAYQQRATGDTAVYIFALSVLFVFLVLAAQYESWSLPFVIVLIVPMSVLSALLGVMLRGQDNNILTQIGLVVLIGLAAKNAILIVEFAQQAEQRGLGAVAAVVEACRLRLRPILMTSLAFILGVVPLVIATGPGAEMRQALGTAVFFGMLGVTLFGLILTPVFYVAVRGLVGWVGARSGARTAAVLDGGEPGRPSEAP